MVKLSSTDKNKISTAIGLAEQNTAAEIAVMLAPASDHYLHFGFMLGIALGSIISLGLWHWHILSRFPILLAVQLCVIVLCAIIPGIGRLLAPKQTQHQHSHQKALAELAHITTQLPPTTPIVLLHLSLAERHIYVLPNAMVRAQLTDEIWQPLVKQFTEALKTTNFADACVNLIQQIGTVLAEPFPDDGAPDAFSNEIIQKR